ncbi:MAG: DsbA family protein [Candidatus Sungiibacteriota bacterium]
MEQNKNNREREEFIEIDGSSPLEEPSPGESRGRSQNPYIIPLSIVIAGVLIAGAVFYSNRGAVDTAAIKNAAGGAVVQGSQPLPGDIAGDAPFLGDPKAPVTVVEFADFQCPFCGRFFQTVKTPLVEQYVKTGKVRFVYRHFAFLGPESEDAAVASACANEQWKFWEYHDYLYTHQQGENEGAFAKANLKKFARAVGLDGAKFDPCLDQERYMNAVRADTAAGKSYGVNGTPATFINGRLISGAQPITQFVSVIEEELKK